MSNTALWFATRGAGAVSLILLSGVVVLGIAGARRFSAPGWPRFLTGGLHRNLALTSVLFVAFHVVTAVVDPFTHLGWRAALVPFGSYYRTFWLGLGAVAFELLVAIVATSLLRGLFGPRAWRLVHWLAYAAWPVAIFHGLGTGSDTRALWMIGIDVACTAAVGTAVAVRLLSGPADPIAADRVRFRQRVSRESSR